MYEASLNNFYKEIKWHDFIEYRKRNFRDVSTQLSKMNTKENMLKKKTKDFNDMPTCLG